MAGLTDQEKQQLDRLMGITTPSSSAVGTLPPSLAGAAFPSSVSLGSGRNRMTLTVPPPASEVQRQLAVDRAKQAQKTLKSIPSSQLKPLEDTDAAIARLQAALQTFQQHHYQTGPLAFRYGRGRIGNALMQFHGQPGEEQFKTLMGRFNNAYLNAQTGSQRGFKEMQWLGSSIPNPELDTPENFLKNAEAALEELHENKQRMMQLLSESGYQTPAGRSSSSMPSAVSQRLPAGVMLAPGLHQDANGNKILVNTDGTYQPQ